MSFIGLQKYVLALFLLMIFIFASSSFAAANDPGLVSALTMHPTNDPPQNISVVIDNDWFAGFFTKFARASTALEHEGTSIIPADEYFGEAAAITLHKDYDKITWSLVPSLSNYSLNLVDDIKNVRVLLRYRF